MPFPGTTYAERNKRENRSEPNWVGWLVSDFAPNPDLLVHDYAVERDGMVDGVIRQVLHQFMPYAGRKPEWASWTQEDALFSKCWLSEGLRHHDDDATIFLPSASNLGWYQ